MQETFFFELHSKFLRPWKRSAFVGYFLLFIIGLGAVDIYYEIYEQYQSQWIEPWQIAKNLAGYALTIISASLLDAILISGFKKIVTLLIGGIFALVVCTILFLVACDTKSMYSFIPAIIMTIVGLYLWVVANSDNDNFNDENFYMQMKKSHHGENW